MSGHETASRHHPCSGEGLSFHYTWRRPQRATIPSGETTWEVKSLTSVRLLGAGGITLFIGLHYSLVFSQAWCLNLCLFHEKLTEKTDLVVRPVGGV